MRFVASQAVRTVAHSECVNVQAGGRVSRSVFLNAMLRLMQKFAIVWGQHPPRLDFFTALPCVGEYFITGDHPVLLMWANNNSIWTPSDVLRQEIASVDVVLNNPSFVFWLTLTPYVCVSVRPGNGAKGFFAA